MVARLRRWRGLYHIFDAMELKRRYCVGMNEGCGFYVTLLVIAAVLIVAAGALFKIGWNMF